MRKKQPRYILLLFAIATLLLLWFLLPPSNSDEKALSSISYQGRSLKSWLTQLDDSNSHGNGFSWEPWSAHTSHFKTQSAQVAAADAIRQMGTNTLPILLSAISKEEPTFLIVLKNLLRRWTPVNTSGLSNHIEQQMALRHQAALAIDALGPEAKPALPRLVKIFYATDNPKETAIAIAAIGPEGWTELTKAVTNTNEWRATCAAWMLGAHRATVPGTVDALTKTLTNTTAGTAGSLAAWALGEIRQNPEQVIPALITSLQSSNIATRWGSVDSLGQFATQATNALPALFKALQDPDPDVRHRATNSIKKISPSILKSLAAPRPATQ